MEKKSEDKKDGESNLEKIYEVGFIFVPTFPEDKLAEEIASFKKILEKNQAHIVSEEFPKLKLLAYSMTKTIGTTKQKFDRGYFGWIKFETEAGSLSPIKKALDENQNIVRFILLKTIRETTPVFPRAIPKPFSFQPIPKPETKEGNVPPTPISIEEIDKSIEELIAK